MIEKLKNKKFEIATFSIYILAMIIFEVGYCNTFNVIKALQGNFIEINYNFSLCRVVFYSIFLIAMYFNIDKFKNDALEIWKSNKIKRIITYIYLILMIITIMVAIIIIIINPLLTRGMSIGLITILMGAIFIIYISNNILRNVIITIFSLGMVFSISINFNHAIDEKKHFMTAFNMASGNFNYGERPITDLQIEALPQISKFTIIDPFLEGKYQQNITEEVNMNDVPSTPATYNFITYLFPAIGIWIAKTIGGSIIDLYIAGRIFNMILYCILICIAIRLTPYKKNIFAVVFLTPIALVLAGTYSVDGFCIGSVGILIAYCLKLKHEEKTLSFKNFIILLGLFLVTLLAKSMAYVMVSFIFLMLPIKETLRKNKKYIPIMIIVTIVSIILLLFLALRVKDTKITSDPRAGNNVNVSEQIKYVLHHPLSDIKLGVNHIKDTFLNMYWYKMLHDEKFFTQDAQCVLIPMMLFVFYISLTEEDYIFNLKDKVIMLLSFFLVYGMTSMVLYLSFSQVGAEHIGGYQTRYILPIVVLPLFCLSHKNITERNKQNRNLKIAWTSGFIILLGIMQSILV